MERMEIESCRSGTGSPTTRHAGRDAPTKRRRVESLVVSGDCSDSDPSCEGPSFRFFPKFGCQVLKVASLEAK